MKILSFNERKKLKEKYKLLNFLPAICVMIGIFYFSSQTAVQSSGLSGNITENIMEVIKNFLNIQEDIKTNNVFFQLAETIIRKSAHMMEYAVLAVTIAYPLKIYGNQGLRLMIWSELISVLYAVTDEFHQLFVPGRSGQLTDVFIDGIGALIGCILFWLISNIIAKKINTKRNRRN
ncbi:VanZ family protein [Mobilisporobacter senegalensis]|uniref:VanZ family protein n=1 Tax=Mobilisporobacter senegalensis TaxID=1329262 RepID=A0A3N1Y2E1_9FIRM|nr:VanZ family protein [Mobilisporobacter senegalensis]ROR31427.1 VanZ family protein [Mobilisporobacter senegalensis]